MQVCVRYGQKTLKRIQSPLPVLSNQGRFLRRADVQTQGCGSGSGMSEPDPLRLNMIKRIEDDHREEKTGSEAIFFSIYKIIFFKQIV